MKDIYSGNKRIIVLQGIERDITLSNEMAQRLLRSYGHSLSLEQVNATVKWLEERELVTIEELNESLWTMALTRRGRDVATGFAKENGVDPPLVD